MSKVISKTLQTGDFAPDFILKDQHNSLVRLSDYRGNKNVVLYFYPKDDTPGCTQEAKCFRDNYEVFRGYGAEVIGISSDSTDTHIKFAGKHSLPFILLSDYNGKVRELYGIQKTLFMIPGRVTFVIDKYGVIRHIFSSQFQAARHIEEALDILRKLD
jgi:peroxiredoxin Q/BCP